MICKECPHMRYNWIKARPDEPYCIGVRHPFKIENINNKCTEYLDGDHDTLPTWGNLNLTYDDHEPPRFIMLVGLPGSGKSTYAHKVLEVLKRSVWLSSDQIREEIYGDANCQKDPSKVFELMHERTVDLLDKGFDVIYDATNITRKNRLAILDKLPRHVSKECMIVWAPLDVCFSRDALRERSVGPEVIEKMLRRFEAPFYDEGFDSIKVHISDVYYNKEQYYVDAISAMNIPHDNPHHTADIMEHCHRCGTALLGETGYPIVVKAGFLHDIGKPLTKTFRNRKGEDCETAHYYDHQAVGAYISYGFKGHNPTLAWLISTHMAPFINQKYYNSLPTCYKKWIDALHKADKEAH